jgi:uncharacterized repeat protein (TIGR01451 family)
MKKKHSQKLFGKSSMRHLARLLLVLLSVAMLSVVLPVFAQPVTITGNVYKDFDASGSRAAQAVPGGPGEPGVAGIVVTAYGATGATVGTATTNSDGDYTLTVNSADPEVRIEFSAIPAYLRSGPAGGNSTTTVTFVPVGTAGVDLAIADPAEYCHTNNPDVAISCYDFGPPNAVAPVNPSVVTFPYLSGSTDLAANSGAATMPETELATSLQVGATWGVAYNRYYGQLYVGAFTKRHVAFGPAGPGGIYVIDPATNATSTLITLAAGADPHDTTNWLADSTTWNAVGRIGLGDIDVSDDGRTLYAVNLFTNTIQTINIGVGGRTATLGGSIASPASCAGARLGGLKWHRGRLFYGVTCTTAGNQSFVYSGGTQVASIPLGYSRGQTSDGVVAANCATTPTEPKCSFWRPWQTAPVDNVAPAADIPYALAFGQEHYPQPLLIDIEFDADNYMVVGIMDRYGHQAGNPSAGTAAGGFSNREGVSAGDVLRLSPNGAGTAWTLETNGSDGRNITLGANNTQGPGGGEFYFDERYTLTSNLHTEIAFGSLLSLPGSGEIVTAAFDAAPLGNVRTNGVIYLSNTSGQRTRSGELIPRDAPGTFGKAAGLGDMEPLCGPAPLEIGNRVWFDQNQNGVQEPGTAEFPYNGVILNLYLDTNCDGTGDRLVGTVTTNAAGEFIFNASTVVPGLIPNVTFWDGNGDSVRQPTEPIGIMPNACYEIRIEDPANFDAGGPLEGFADAVQTLFVTRRGGGPGQRDNNGAESGGLITSGPIRTLGFGNNDHTWDFGFTDTPPPPPVQPPGDPGEPTPQFPPNIAKSVQPPFGAPGTTHTWTIQVQNPHDRDINNVAVSDPVPPQLTILSATADAGNVTVSGQVVYWSIETMNPGQTVTITLVTRVNGNVAVPFIIENTATLENGYIGSASARILSAGGLPATGEQRRP